MSFVETELEIEYIPCGFSRREKLHDSSKGIGYVLLLNTKDCLAEII